MARKARQRISYVLPLANSPGGHRLGVNGLAVDSAQSILYSGGRDGVICAWDLDLDLQHSSSSTETTSPHNNPRNPTSRFRKQIQAHTHWVNDITLVQNNSALVSASSDITVKIWRLHSEDSQNATTIGLHSDYAKCLASPSSQADWIASGGLDRKIRLWDLNGHGEKLQIDVGEEENSAKGSVYALSARGSIMASGGPESIVRLWDPKTGKRVTKLVGHTDNVRDILINQEGDTVMTASADQTVKVWSITAGRCVSTLSMHNHSVWCLYSNHPQLSVFYSADRSGLVAKTDTRASAELDQGLSLAVAQEHEGISKLVAAGDYFWTATSSSSINRWKDTDTQAEFRIPDSLQRNREASISDIKLPSPVQAEHAKSEHMPPRKSIPVNCVLRLSNTSSLPQSKQHMDSVALSPGAGLRKQSEDILDSDLGVIVPIQTGPEETIEGQNGLIKHLMLNDRKRVLTMDTAGEVVLWDLLKCVPVQSFGKRHLEDVVPEVNTLESVANWCAVDTRTGTLAVSLEENYCFDAEMYADELVDEDQSVFREDQRINLGRWVLRYLFADLIEEELRRDDAYRQKLQGHHGQPTGHQRQQAPSSIQLPPQPFGFLSHPDDSSVITPRAVNGYPATTPGLDIGVATPGAHATSSNVNGSAHLTTVTEYTSLGKRDSKVSQSRASGDYFSSAQPSSNPADSQTAAANTGATVTDGASQQPPTPGAKDEAEKGDKTKEVSSLFGKKFRMNFPKKLGRSSVEATKPAVVDEIKSEESDDKSSTKEEKIVEDNFLGSIQKIRIEYDEKLEGSDAGDNSLQLLMTPSPANETPILKPPPFTPVIIQEDQPDSGGVADLYRGQVGSLGTDADMIEKTAPMWLGELLLRNQVPPKEIVKVSFVLLPYGDLLPGVASPDGNSRLNANRMLRAKKILSYVADRIEPAPEDPDPNALKPEEYLELYCQNQRVPDHMTLATLRAHVWKTGGDVMLYYKSNGRKLELEKRHQLAQQQQQQIAAAGK